jgi:uncharacterized protein
MDITPQIPQNLNVISGYGVKGFEISEKFYQNSVILTPNRIIEVKLASIAEFCSYDLTKIFANEPEILLIGTGQNHQILPLNLKNNIKKQYQNIAISEMSSASACRTYNILMAEDRNVATLLMKL